MKKNVYIIASILLIHLVLLVIFAGNRIADADEGVYFNAARMINQGMSIYSDFFYTQLMVMPTIFAPFSDSGWISFFALRGFAVLAGFLSIIILALVVSKYTNNFQSTILAVAMYSLSGLMISWHSVFKALPFCHLLSLATFYFWYLFYEKNRMIFLIATGMILSLLINFRSVYIILLPLYLISIWQQSSGFRTRNIFIFVLSMIPFAIPTMLKLINSYDHFMYGNLMFQLYREADRSLMAIFNNRILTYLKAMIDPHIFIIFALTLLSVYLLKKNGKLGLGRRVFVTPEGLALMNLLLIFLVHLLPHPISRQYIEQFLAFGIILVGFSFVDIKIWIKSRLKKSFIRPAIYVLSVLYVLALIPYFVIFIGGVRSFDRRYRIDEISAVTEKMKSLASVSDTILSEWPGYTFITRQPSLRYTEIIGAEYTMPLEHDEYLKYKMADRIYLNEKISQQTPELVVTVYDPPDYYAEALYNNYEIAFRSDVVSIYKKR